PRVARRGRRPHLCVLPVDRAPGWCHAGPMTIQPAAPPFSTPDVVAFDRRELAVILSLYGRLVAAGGCGDYGMSFLRDMAVFSVFRRAAEHPLCRIEKRPRLRNAQGMYAVVGMDGQILRRGHDLAVVLRALERKLIRPV